MSTSVWIYANVPVENIHCMDALLRPIAEKFGFKPTGGGCCVLGGKLFLKRDNSFNADGKTEDEISNFRSDCEMRLAEEGFGGVKSEVFKVAA